MNRMMEVSGCRRLLCRAGRVDGRHEQTWLGQMMRWMQRQTIFIKICYRKINNIVEN